MAKALEVNAELKTQIEKDYSPTTETTFVGKDERIKQGMTANVNIITENKSNVIAVPARFVTVVNATKGMVMLDGKKKGESKIVALGIRGADGSIEVTQGLLEGDVLLPPSTVTREAQKQTQ